MEHRHCFPYPSLGVQAERLPCPGVGCCAPREVARASGCGDLLRLATRSWSDGAGFCWRSPSITTSQKDYEAVRHVEEPKPMLFLRWIGEWISMLCFFRVLLWNAGWQGLFSRICRLSRLSQWWSMMGCDGFQLYSAEFAIPVVSAVCRYPCDGPCEIWMSRKGTPCRCHCYTV